MQKKLLLLLCVTVLTLTGAKAQVTTSPNPLQEDSEGVVIYYHADQGNKGLVNLPASTKIYAHTGVITNESSSTSDWKYTVADWNQNLPKCQLEYVSENLWSLYIGDIREFYGITNPSVTVKQLAFVFRNSDGSKEGKTSSNGDIFVEVVDAGLQISLTDNIHTEIVDATTGAVAFTVSSTLNADLSLSVNGEMIANVKNSSTLTKEYTFSEMKDYAVTATATLNGEEVSVTNNYAYFSLPEEREYPGGVPVMGPVKNSDGSVTFCVAAPYMERMVLVGSWNDYKITNSQQMYYTDFELTNPVTNESGSFRYFWTTVEGLGNTTDQYIYFFKVNGTVSNGTGGTETISSTTCDPYARLVLDPWNDKYLITDVYPGLPEYPYDVVNGVPVAVYQSNFNDYDWQVENFEAPDKTNLVIYELLFRDFTGTEGQAYGNGTVKLAMEKLPYLKQLGVNAIEVLPICEFEGNNSWGYNPNFYFAIDKAYGTPSDYKEFIDACHQNGIAVILDMVFNQSAGQHPWYQMYGGPLYSPFYNVTAPHAYSVLNDWNQGYPLVQQQWADVIRYWLTEYKFDGFRFDLVKGLGTNDSYKNSTESATDAYNASRVAEMKYLHGIMKEINPAAYCINENLAGAQEENEMAADGELNWLNMNDPACEFAMGWPEKSNLNNLYAPKSGRNWGSTVSYLESHDEQRLAYKQDQYGVNGVKGNVEASMKRLGSTAAQMLMTPGSHMIWQFSEMGNAQNTKTNIGNNVEPKIVNWSLLNEPNHKGLYDSYCQLISLRMENPEFFSKEASFTINCLADNWSKGRSLVSVLDGQELLTVVNPNYSGGDLTYNYPFIVKDNSAYKILSQSYGSEASFDAVNGTITVPVNSYVVIGNVGLNDAGIDNIASENKSEYLRARGGLGQIIVDYTKDIAVIYSLDGRYIGMIKDSGRLNVSAGLYIVKSGSYSSKIIVR